MQKMCALVFLPSAFIHTWVHCCSMHMYTEVLLGVALFLETHTYVYIRTQPRDPLPFPNWNYKASMSLSKDIMHMIRGTLTNLE